MITIIKKTVGLIRVNELPQSTFEQFGDWLEMYEGYEIPWEEMPSGLLARLKNNPVLPSKVRASFNTITHFQFQP